MIKLLTTLFLVLFTSIKIFSQIIPSDLEKMNSTELSEYLKNDDLNSLKQLNEDIITYMTDDILKAIESNSIPIMRGVNEIIYLKQSQINWEKYIQNFTSYIGSSYTGGSILKVVYEESFKKFYTLRLIELIQNHKRWKMDQ